jgi:hypothetical protein
MMISTAVLPVDTPPQAPPSPTELIDLMTRLGDLLAHETEIVRSGRIGDVAPLQREKLRLLEAYKKALTECSASGMKLSALPPPLRAQLIDASTTLAQRVSENERALRIGCTATRRLLDSIVSAIQTQQRSQTRYNARLKPTQGATVLTLAFDRRL